MSPLTGNIDGMSATASPARALQQQLEMHTAVQQQSDVQKWSPRSSFFLIVAASAALWIALIAAAAQLVRAIA
jgi:hypothetical protein